MTGRWMIAALLILLGLALTVPAVAAQFVEILPGTFPSAVGGAWGDYDNDGYPDLFLAGGDIGSGMPVGHGPLLYHNHRDLTFSDVSAALGLPYSVIAQGGVAWGDYDNDGLPDVLLGGAARPYLYKRDLTGFAEVTASAGFPMQTNTTASVAWADYDGDNLLDAFCSNIFGPGYLMHNNGDGSFAEMAALAGMTDTENAATAAWGDYDNDGTADLAIARMFGKPAKLYRNNGNGTFADVSDLSDLSVVVDASSAVWDDYDNDRYLDLYVGGRLFHNDTDGTLTDVSAAAGVLGPATGAGAAWADYDNDGYLDLYIVHWGTHPYLYHSNGNGSFADLALGSGLEAPFFSQGTAAIWADIDLDGRMDLLQCTSATTSATNRSLLYHNIGPAGNWLRVRSLTSATGNATGDQPLRDAVGARVELSLDNDDSFPTAGHRTLTRLIDGGYRYQGGNEQVAQFGLGTATLVAVRVRFPDGSIVIHRSVPANGQITIRDVPADREEIFDDVPLDFWAYEQVRGCVDSSIVAGYDDGLYHPDWPVTRDQMAVYISRALAGGDDNVPDFTDTPTFPDVDADNWALDYIEYAVDQGVVTGYDDGTYHPEYEVTRDQMAVYVARALVAPTGEAALADYVPSDPRNFPDVTNTFWAYRHIEYCVEHGVVSGYGDGYYHPEITVTRDQMAVYVARAFGL